MTAVRRKPDADAIAEFLTALPRRLKLDARRSAWTRYAYHYTDVRNAAQVLAGAELLSRERCGMVGVSFYDAANREVIEQSRQAHHYVRLYFRPRTPTQYNMEGIKAPDEISRDAHCPVPVFFLFDARELLGQAGTLFSDGSLARRAGHRIGDTAEFLADIPFDAVYHDSAFPPERRDELVFRRQAEVLIRDRLGLDALTQVVCRSGPERTTLLNLLGNRAPEWAGRVRLERADEGLFFKRGVYVTAVTLIGRRLTIDTTRSGRAFSCAVRVVCLPERSVLVEETRSPVNLLRPITVDLPVSCERIGVELLIGDALAFRGTVSQRSLL